MSFKTIDLDKSNYKIYSFIAPDEPDIESSVKMALKHFNPHSIKEEYGLDLDNLNIPVNKWTGQKEIYVHVDRLKDKRDFAIFRSLLLDIGFIDGMAL